MADVELVIKIPEEAYQGVVNGRWGNGLLGVLCTGVENGTLLPKGHGRLIDADKTLKNTEKIYSASNIKDIINPTQMYAIRKMLTTSSTIIEADKEEKEREEDYDR